MRYEPIIPKRCTIVNQKISKIVDERSEQQLTKNCLEKECLNVNRHVRKNNNYISLNTNRTSRVVGKLVEKKKIV